MVHGALWKPIGRPESLGLQMPPGPRRPWYASHRVMTASGPAGTYMCVSACVYMCVCTRVHMWLCSNFVITDRGVAFNTMHF